MGSDFMNQFLAGWKMGQGRNENTRRDQEMLLEQQRQQQMLQQRSEEFEFQKEEFAVRKKQLAAEEAATKLKAAHEARKLREEASYLQGMPQPTAAEVGVPQQGPEFGGPMVSEINVPQPMQAMPDPTGGADIQMPVLTGRQQLEMEQAEKQKKIREALGMLDAQEGIKAQYREKPKGLDEIFAEARARAAGGRAGAPLASSGGGGTTTGLSQERQERLARILPEAGDWRSVTAQTPILDNETTRGGNRAALAEWAASNGVLLPSKAEQKIVLSAKEEMADIEELKKYLTDPEVIKDLGAYRGRLTNFLSKGWAGESKVSKKTLAFRSNLNQMAAKKRHEIYGAAVTGTETGFAAGFIPAIDQGFDSMVANINEFEDQINRGMTARWGGGKAAPTAGAPSGGDYEATAVPGVRRRKVQR